MTTPIFASHPFPSGIITLTTDFGHRDPFVGVMKGSILTRWPDAKIVDLTHETLVHWPAEAGFWLTRSYEYFPRGSVHVAVVDPGVGTRRDIVVVEADGHIFLAPDNGLLAPLINRITNRGEQFKAHRLDLSRLTHLGLAPPSATFHGRDIFGPVAAELAAGRMRPPQLGAELKELVPAWVDEPDVSDAQIAGVVITVDHFGNLITNIEAASLARFKQPRVRAGSHEFGLRRTYGDVRPGEFLALVNAFKVVEIARAEGSATEGLGLGRGTPVTVTDS
jgi:S-adenosylmethionine hydrolase